MTRGICGPSSPDAFAFYDPDSSSLKTSQATLLSDSTGCSVTLPKWGSMFGGGLYELRTPALLTSGHGFSGLLGTPTARDWKDGVPQDNVDTNGLLGRQAWALLPTPTTDDASNVTRDSGDYQSLVRTVSLLPTPRSQNGEARNSTVWVRPLDQPQNIENALARLPGACTSPPSDDGKQPSDDQPPGQLTIEDA